jgi:hypothetical protein
VIWYESYNFLMVLKFSLKFILWVKKKNDLLKKQKKIYKILIYNKTNYNYLCFLKKKKKFFFLKALLMMFL